MRFLTWVSASCAIIVAATTFAVTPSAITMRTDKGLILGTDSATLTLTVSDPARVYLPTGNVSVFDLTSGGEKVCTAPLTASATATCAFVGATAGLGAHVLRAWYAGDTHLSPSQSSDVTVTVAAPVQVSVVIAGEGSVAISDAYGDYPNAASVVVPQGDRLTFTMTPASGYRVDTLSYSCNSLTHQFTIGTDVPQTFDRPFSSDCIVLINFTNRDVFFVGYDRTHARMVTFSARAPSEIAKAVPLKGLLPGEVLMPIANTLSTRDDTEIIALAGPHAEAAYSGPVYRQVRVRVETGELEPLSVIQTWPGSVQIYPDEQVGIRYAEQYGPIPSTTRFGLALTDWTTGSGITTDPDAGRSKIELLGDLGQHLQLDAVGRGYSPTSITTLSYQAGDAGAGNVPHTPYLGAHVTGVPANPINYYAIDTTRRTLVRITGDLAATIGALGISGTITGGGAMLMSADGTNAHVALVVDGVAKLYRVRIDTGAATAIGTIGDGTGLVEGLFATVPPKSCLDLDGDGVVRPDTDGVLLLRGLLGFSGATATAGALPVQLPPRSTWTAIANHMNIACGTAFVGAPVAPKAVNECLDADGDGVAGAQTDGLMLMRVFTGQSGNSVLAGATSVTAPPPRATWTALSAHLGPSCGVTPVVKSPVVGTCIGGVQFPVPSGGNLPNAFANVYPFPLANHTVGCGICQAKLEGQCCSRSVTAFSCTPEFQAPSYSCKALCA